MSWFDIDDLHPASVTVHQTTRGAPGPSGVVTKVEVPRVIEHCSLQQVGTAETVGEHDLVTERMRVSCVALEQWVKDGDRVTVPDSTDVFYVEGRPAHFTGTGDLDHTEFVIKTTRGA